MDKDDFQKIFKQFLEREKHKPDCVLDKDDINELLIDDSEIIDESPRPDIYGYPSRPLHREISSILHIWMITGQCPLLNLPKYDLLDEQEYAENRLETISSITPMLSSLQSLWSVWSEDERKYTLRNLIKLLEKRGLLDLLGIRKTVGTYDLWPPPRRVLERTFKEKHKPMTDSILTVGARALAKHCHRDETSSWWGECTGRYGIRWTCDGMQFRGFLEPQMIDGHAVGWRH
ncbi:hypothetical protein LSH36_6g01092 [Paralvinella palmiformis]|uniref:Uncharacterized protein n=1 Tax=Paralvinella palmiformis TaxID=53620 RepID=A0AAD9KET2_9ANNE|nr:hypothetical protein LSH36_6g01092 [Paralvinella palmiformis]